jgi:hypothetical protein
VELHDQTKEPSQTVAVIVQSVLSCSGAADRRKARLDRSLGAATCRIGMPKEGSNAAKQAQLSFAKLFL